jgi:antitoxin component YwqK of YwqJK toxin-antitoxin module
MKLNRIILITSALILITSIWSCKTKINQTKNNLQVGKWITTDTLDYLYITKGRYRKGKPKGTWVYIYNGKIDRKEKYRKGKCLTTFYHKNGKILRKGYTKLDENKEESHWYYSGKWNYFDENGQPTRTNFYEKGKLIDSIVINKVAEISNKNYK